MNGSYTGRICSKCGTPVNDGQNFCIKCGTKIMPEYSQYNSVYGGVPPKKNSNTGVYIAVFSVIAVLLVGLIAFLAYYITVSKNDNNVVIEEPTNEYYLDTVINDYINSTNQNGNMSVAVYDNRTGKYYYSNNSSQSYVAWGLYLPIYLVYNDYYTDGYVRNNILSADAGTCNKNANTAIYDMGGLYNVNSLIRDRFNTNTTNYGRLFGDTSSSSDNYTSASEALDFLVHFNKYDSYSKLSYNLASFNIYPPSNATVYAHAGTENRNVRKDMNLFAIVKGNYSDYCIVVLTRNNASGRISDLLSVVHSALESEAR